MPERSPFGRWRRRSPVWLAALRPCYCSGFSLASASPFTCREERKSSACYSHRETVVCPLDSSISGLERAWSSRAFWFLGSWFILDGTALFSFWASPLSSGLCLGSGFSLAACKRRTRTRHHRILGYARRLAACLIAICWGYVSDFFVLTTTGMCW